MSADILLATDRLRGAAIVPRGLERAVGEALPEVVRRLADELHPEKIILFGSFAYGSPTPDSDVDLLVIMRTDEQEKDRTWAVSRLLLPRPFPVDILVRTPAEIEAALAAHDAFLSEIFRRGQVLYERP